MTNAQLAEMDAEMMLAEGIAPDRVALIICEDYAIKYGAASDITNHAARALREPPAVPVEQIIELESADEPDPTEKQTIPDDPGIPY